MAMTLDGSNGVTFNDSSLQGAAASPYVLKNRIINGAMEIDQRNAGASVTPADEQYTLDRWVVYHTAASKFSVQQNAGSVTPPTGFTNYLGVTSLSAYTVSASDYFVIGQRIEGFNTSDLAWGTANAKTVTLSFWIRSSLTGTFGGSLMNNAGTQSYPFTYTISAANTWEQKTITIAGSTTGTWVTTNGRGVQVQFGLGVGSTYSASAGSWVSATEFSATGATSVVGTNGATWYITGVQLEIGSTATPFERRMYGTELALCQRYFEMTYDIGTAPGTVTYIGSWYSSFNGGSTTGYAGGVVSYKVTKRAIPTLSTWDVSGNSGKITRENVGSAQYSNNTPAVGNAGTNNCLLLSSSGSTCQSVSAQWTASAEL